MQHYDALTNSEIDERITERIHNARDRELLRRRLIDGMTYDELSAEFFLSRRQVARIIAKASSILTTEHPPNRRHRKGTPASLRGCFFYAMIKSERRCDDVRISESVIQSVCESISQCTAHNASRSETGSRESQWRERRTGISYRREQLCDVA